MIIPNRRIFAYSFLAIFLLVFAFRATSALAALPVLDVYVSSSKVMQADTILVAVKNAPEMPTGRIGAVKLRFYQEGNNWVAVPGIAVNKVSGFYALSVSVPGYKTFTKSIVVFKRKFPVTVLAVTPELKQKGYTAKKIISTIKNEENVLLNKVLQEISTVPYSTKPFIYPLAENMIMGNYGDIRKSGTLKIQHLGVDLKAPLGTNVLAVNDGKVVFEKSLPDYGNTLVVDHGLGVYSLYLHLSQFNVAEGDMVAQGQTIALSGATGYVTGPHLHFSIKMRGASIDPLKFIETTKTVY